MKTSLLATLFAGLLFAIFVLWLGNSLYDAGVHLRRSMWAGYTLSPLEPQPVRILLPGGERLAGRFYAARREPAPVVVLVHWAVGTQADWAAIAPWLQNRGLAAPPPQSNVAWLDPSWFPPLSAETNLNVLTFDFECMGDSDCTYRTGLWLQDAFAAVRFAGQMEAVDSNAIITVGASIGADGAADGCYLFNQAVAAGEAQGQCVGALSLSPGSFLTSTFKYSDAADTLLAAGHVVYCFGSDTDGTARHYCEATDRSAQLHTFNYSRFHGMQLITPQAVPQGGDENTMELVVDFIGEAIGQPIRASH